MGSSLPPPPRPWRPARGHAPCRWSIAPRSHSGGGGSSGSPHRGRPRNRKRRRAKRLCRESTWLGGGGSVPGLGEELPSSSRPTPTPTPAPPQRPGVGRHLGEGELEAPLSARPPFCGGRCQPRREAQLRTLWGSTGPFAASSSPLFSRVPNLPSSKGPSPLHVPSQRLPPQQGTAPPNAFFSCHFFFIDAPPSSGISFRRTRGPWLDKKPVPLVFSRRCHAERENVTSPLVALEQEGAGTSPQPVLE